MKSTRSLQNILLNDSVFFFCGGLFFISSDQEFVLHLDTSEGKEDESGSDDEAGAASTPGKFTVMVFKIKVVLCIIIIHMLLRYQNLIFVVLLWAVLPCAAPGPGAGQAVTTAAPYA